MRENDLELGCDQSYLSVAHLNPCNVLIWDTLGYDPQNCTEYMGRKGV